MDTLIRIYLTFLTLSFFGLLASCVSPVPDWLPPLMLVILGCMTMLGILLVIWIA